MRFSTYAPILLLPTAIASASPDVQNGVTLIAVEGVTQEDVHLLVRRQLDLGGIVGSIGDLLDPLFDLLSSGSLKNINLIITNLASVLGNLDVQQTRDLLELIDGLINSDATQGLLDTLGSFLPVCPSSVFLGRSVVLTMTDSAGPARLEPPHQAYKHPQ
jgi:hypothetical protein